MKKFYSLAAIAMISSSAFAQSTVFNESFGTPATQTPIGTYTGYSSSALTFSGTGVVDNGNPSTGYPGVSANGNVLLAAGNDLGISGISTINKESLILYFGAWKSTTSSDMSELKLEYSTDGTTWATLTIPPQLAGPGTNSWRLIAVNLPTLANNQANLHFRWTNNSTTTSFRLDDILLSVGVNLALKEVNLLKYSFIKNTLVNNEIYFGQKSDIKIINMVGQVVKTASVNNGTVLNVSGLSKGVYLVMGNVKGYDLVQKIVKQ